MTFAVEAGSEQEARAIASGVLDQMGNTAAVRELQAGPVPEGLWTVTADVDLGGAKFEPDNAETRLSSLTGELAGVTWTSRVTERTGRLDWPPDVWSRQPGRDDVLGHPAIRAAAIWAAVQDA